MDNLANLTILGSYGRNNIGDDLFLETLLGLLHKHQITINAASVSNFAPNIISKVNVIPTDGTGGFLNMFKVFWKAQYILYGGGDLWVELYGDKFPKSSLYKMALLNVLCRLFRKKIIYVGCGSGDLHGYGLWLARFSAGQALSIIFRDQVSRHKIREDEHTFVLPDLTCTLIEHQFKLAHNVKPSMIAAMAPLYYIPHPKKNYSAYLDIQISICEDLLKRGYAVDLIPMQKNNSIDDVKVCKDIEAGIDKRWEEFLSVRYEAESSNIHSLLANYDVVIATRLHAAILSVWAGKPCFGISYRPKVLNFFKSVGLNECVADFIIDDNTIFSQYEAFMAALTQHKQKVLIAREKAKTAAYQYKRYFESIQ